MYTVAVALLMLVLPLASIAVEVAALGTATGKVIGFDES